MRLFGCCYLATIYRNASKMTWYLIKYLSWIWKTRKNDADLLYI